MHEMLALPINLHLILIYIHGGSNRFISWCLDVTCDGEINAAGDKYCDAAKQWCDSRNEYLREKCAKTCCVIKVENSGENLLFPFLYNFDFMSLCRTASTKL